MKMTTEQLEDATQILWEMSDPHTEVMGVKVVRLPWDDLLESTKDTLRDNLIRMLGLMFPEEEIEIL